MTTIAQDEQAIRDLVSRWMEASRKGDAATVLSLITDDVVFLLPDRPPLRRDEFAAQVTAQAGAAGPRIDGKADIQEIQIAGDWAFAWTRLSITVTPPDGATLHRAGHTLSVFRRDGGQWKIARDANLLTPATRATS
jgi:uncharacterized protein (TIGR02246 family)